MRIKVFFNNSCSICRLEINHYKKVSDSHLEWIDITNNQDALKLTSKSQEELLRRLHVIDNGEVISGAKAFIIIWSKIPKYKLLSKIFSFKPIYILFHYAYEFVSYLLFLKNKNLLKWKNNTYLLKFVLFVKNLFFGEKNGSWIGIELNIVLRSVLS